MEVHIVAREVTKPSSPAIQHKKPYKFSFFDQLTPATYVPIVYFYPKKNNSEPNLTTQTLTHLKKSLSQTLDLYYPFSGRTNDNLYVDRFDEGVPFLEAKVNCSMSEFLKRRDTESLNRFLPCQPFSKEVNMNIPLSAFQVSIFTCGGIALGWCLSHKLIDGSTASAFVTTWASIFRGDLQDVIKPDLNEASLVFPPKISFPQNHLSLMESLWFTEANYVTRRFVFNAKAIATLRDKAKGKLAAPPSRIETLSCFIWKCGMTATKQISGVTKPSILVEAVNLRQNTKPPMSDASSGNLFWWAIAVANPTDTNTEFPELVSLLSEAIAHIKVITRILYKVNMGLKPCLSTVTSYKSYFPWKKIYLHLRAGKRCVSLVPTLDGESPFGLVSWEKLALSSETSQCSLTQQMVKG
ncbi:hypothetical protein GH714_033201 [Hevea brasiliensis]|uniref:Uncharacterized protein n=1 Tax=Hevea brasiliensis TaxID=3981 RepID=A0A6A6L654_HEVBR|nr:hypothetical protein GH714_033201 [Hevea brasiliensis]